MNIRTKKWLIFLITVFGNFLAVLDSTTVNVALYNIANDFSLTMSQVQWVYTAYMLILTSLLPFFGKLGDVVDKNKIYSFGFFLFGLGAFLNFTATSFAQLIVYRCIEAIGGSILIANSMAIVSNIFKGQDRGKALGLLGAVVSLGGMTGPAIGGVLMDLFSWNYIFLINVPIAFISMILAYKFIPSYSKKVKFQFDFIGFVFFFIFMFPMLLCLSQGHSWGWISQKILILAAISLAACVLFYIREDLIDYPMIDFKLFKNKTILWGCISMIICYISIFANGILFPFFAQKILHFSALKTALVIFPYSVAIFFIAPIAGNYSGKNGSRILTTSSGLIILLGYLFFIKLNASSGIFMIILGQIISGAGTAVFQSPANNAIMSASSKKDFGITSGMVGFSRNFGMIMGVAISTMLFDGARNFFYGQSANFSSAFTNAYHFSIFIGCLWALLCSSLAYYAFKKR